MRYCEHVSRVAAKHQARIEAGLAQARLQERFVDYIVDILYKNDVRYDFHLNDDFEPIFYLNRFSGCLKTLFPYFHVEQDGAQWILSGWNKLDIQVIIREGMADEPE